MRKEADPSPIWAAVPAQPLVASTEGLEEDPSLDQLGKSCFYLRKVICCCLLGRVTETFRLEKTSKVF